MYISKTQIENAAKVLWKIKHPVATDDVWDQLGKKKKDGLEHAVKNILASLGVKEFMVVPDGDPRLSQNVETTLVQR